jgi:hypothetical protein
MQVLTLAELPEDPHMRAVGMFREATHPCYGRTLSKHAPLLQIFWAQPKTPLQEVFDRDTENLSSRSTKSVRVLSQHSHEPYGLWVWRCRRPFEAKRSVLIVQHLALPYILGALKQLLAMDRRRLDVVRRSDGNNRSIRFHVLARAGLAGLCGRHDGGVKPV